MWIGGGVMGSFLVALMALVSWFVSPSALAVKVRLTIPRQVSVAHISQILKEQRLISWPFLYEAAVRLWGHARSLHAGRYDIPAHASPKAITDILVEGKSIMSEITIPEGLTNQEVLARLKAHPDIVDKPCEDLPPEGMLYPETYTFAPGTPLPEIVKVMHSKMKKTLNALWALHGRPRHIESPEQALVLASIVEMEAKKHAERPWIAAAFLNRLKRDMALQADPTIIYALTKGKKSRLGRRITPQDLKYPSPFNTYLNKGLPPTAVVNPSLKSLEAVFKPKSTEDIYFVSDGEGGHFFAATKRHHTQNVSRFREICRASKSQRSPDNPCKA